MREVAFATVLISLGSLMASAQAPQPVPPSGSKAPQSGYTVVRSYPHDPKAYTQGLEYFDGFLYEGTGMKGNSAIRKVELESGKVVQETKLHPQYFGEGITIAQGKAFQLTWQDRAGFVYEAKTLKFIRNFSYFGEGWGLTHDPAGLIMSDGTSTLRFLEVTRFQERRRVKVMDAGVAIERLNELEMIRGEIWANVWQTDYIVRISPKEGRVLGWINLKGLLGAPLAKLGPDAVLNGIAFDAQKNRIFVTGKLWPRLFEIAIK
jgi:glutaminyl-peptide cyclotransferase